jgi:hypothetical protein
LASFRFEMIENPLMRHDQAIDGIQFEYDNGHEVLKVRCQDLDADEPIMVKWDFY